MAGDLGLGTRIREQSAERELDDQAQSASTASKSRSASTPTRHSPPLVPNCRARAVACGSGQATDASLGKERRSADDQEQGEIGTTGRGRPHSSGRDARRAGPGPSRYRDIRRGSLESGRRSRRPARPAASRRRRRLAWPPMARPLASPPVPSRSRVWSTDCPTDFTSSSYCCCVIPAGGGFVCASACPTTRVRKMRRRPDKQDRQPGLMARCFLIAPHFSRLRPVVCRSRRATLAVVDRPSEILRRYLRGNHVNQSGARNTAAEVRVAGGDGGCRQLLSGSGSLLRVARTSLAWNYL